MGEATCIITLFCAMVCFAVWDAVRHWRGDKR